MPKYTKSQLAWRPGQRKKIRSTRTMFASTVLTLEAFVVLFAGLVMFGLRGRAEGNGLPFLLLGVGLAVVLIVTCAFLRHPWGIALGWGLQVVLIGLGILEPMMYIVGVLFLLAWTYGILQGGRIDRENVVREREQLAWEAEHPEPTPEAGT